MVGLFSGFSHCIAFISRNSESMSWKPRKDLLFNPSWSLICLWFKGWCYFQGLAMDVLVASDPCGHTYTHKLILSMYKHSVKQIYKEILSSTKRSCLNERSILWRREFYFASSDRDFFVWFLFLFVSHLSAEWIGYEGREIKKAVEGKKEQSQEDTRSKEGRK